MSAAKIAPNDGQRIQRALEIERLAADQPSKKKYKTDIDTPYEFLQFVITATSRKQLHQQIEQRAKQMLENGLIQEVEALYKRYSLSRSSNSMRCVGYRQVLAMLHNELPENELSKAVVQATRQLAKRQLTWMRQKSGMIWVNVDWEYKTAFILKRIEAF